MTELLEKRTKTMIGMGLTFNGQEFCKGSVNFHWTDLSCMTEEEFDKAVEGAKSALFRENALIGKKRNVSC